MDNLYILDKTAYKVKISFTFLSPEARDGSVPPSMSMIASMTGFAAAAAELPGCSLTVELRSVNHRYLDVQVRLPDELRALDGMLRDLLTGNIRRGKVDCRITLNHMLPGAATLAVNAERVAQLREAATEILRHAPDSAPITVADILRWPGVLAEPSIAPEELAQRTIELVRTALADLTASRRREGAKLKAMLEERCRAIEAQVARVAPRIPAIHAAYVEKLGARLKEAGLDPDAERLKGELALFATKIDVAEEVSRLSTHVAEVRRVLAEGGSSGKRLDFLMQELNREANTLGSKSVDAELSQAALEIKVLIEQMREQVQNIE